MAELLVGAGKQTIAIPDEYLEAENFGQIHDPLHARAVAISQSSSENTGEQSSVAETILIISLEITSIPEEEVSAIRSLIAGKTSVKPENIWLCVTHSFSSPHLLPDHLPGSERMLALKNEYRRNLTAAACEAAVEAMAQLQPATMGINTGDCNIVANRDIEFEDGWWVGANGDGPANPTVTVLRFNDKNGNPIALISHFAMQSSVMDQVQLSDGKKPLTSDVAGNACRMTEAESGEKLVALFLIGAAGDQAPIEKAVSETFSDGQRIRTDLQEGGFEICDRLAGLLRERICEIAHEAVCDQNDVALCTASAAVTVPTKHMNRDLHCLRPSRNVAYEPDGETTVTIEGIRIGSSALLGVKPELNCCTAALIMSQSAFPFTLVCTLVNGASKYMADADSYDRCTYEAQNSPFARGAAELLAGEAVKLLEKLNFCNNH